jgi:hypothetical protein
VTIAILPRNNPKRHADATPMPQRQTPESSTIYKSKLIPRPAPTPPNSFLMPLIRHVEISLYIETQTQVSAEGRNPRFSQRNANRRRVKVRGWMDGLNNFEGHCLLKEAVLRVEEYRRKVMV